MSKPFTTSIDSHGIAELVFNKPPVNAFTSQGWADIAAEIEDLGQTSAVRVIIIAAEGRGFCGAADIIVASECATFAVPEVDRGAMGGGAHLQRMFPVQKVRYMYFTGEAITAQEAYRLGAVEKVVPKEKLRETAREIALKIAEKSPVMIALAKEALTGIEDGNLEDKYRWEQGFTLQAYSDKDSQEARDAFVEKRDAKF